MSFSGSATRKAGFTFLELIIAVTIFSIIASGIFMSLRAGVRLWKRSREGIEQTQALRVFFRKVSTDLKNAVVYDPGAKNFEGSAAKMSFMTVVPASYGGGLSGRELARVAYAYDPKTRTVTWACARKAETFDIGKAAAVDVLYDIDPKDFAFEYYYTTGTSDTSYTWKDSWKEEEKVPGGVRIRVGGYTRYVGIPTGESAAEE